MTIWLAITGYSLAWVLQARLAVHTQTPPRWQRVIPVLSGALAVACHLLALAQHLLLPDSIDVNIINLFTLLAVMIVIFNWLISRSNEQELLELAIYPLAVLSLLLLNYVPVSAVKLSTLDSLAATHIISSLLAYALLSLCALLAIQIAVQDIMLRRHQALWLFQKIPLMGLENLLFQLMLAGVLLLTIALLSGVWFIDNWFAQHLVHKTVLSLLSWLVFSILLFGRWRLGWRGQWAVRLTLAGMLLLLLAYFGAKWVLEVLKQSSWSG